MSSSSFMLMFGGVWTGFVFLMSLAVVLSGALEALAILSIFWIIGIIFLIIGIRKKIIDSNTDKYGEVCFAKIKNVYSDTVINGRREFKAEFIVYVPSERDVRIISEIIGFDPVDYPKNGYAKVKYFKRDINILKAISVNLVPVNIKEILDKGPTPPEHYEGYSGYDYDIDENYEDEDNGPISYK